MAGDRRAIIRHALDVAASAVKDHPKLLKKRHSIDIQRSGSKPVGTQSPRRYARRGAIITDRAQQRPEDSGTVEALDKGLHFLGKKVVEEAGEVWLAAEYQSDDELSEEISQLLYWLQVVAVKRGLSLDDIYRYL